MEIAVSPMAGKRRRWIGYLTVSASGPEYRIQDASPRGLVSRMQADLLYTTADVDFLETHFQKEHMDTAEFEMHRRLRNPTREQFFQGLAELGSWLYSNSRNHAWDGGGIQLCFAGHGREGDGGLFLSDGVIAPEELACVLAGLSDQPAWPGRLRISAVLDSCHSGAFITELLDQCFTTHNAKLVPFNFYAACMEDEFAWEVPELGHGLFTYCYSNRRLAVDSLAAEAVQPDNTYGPSLAIASGDFGCSLLSVGRQNPIVYWNGAGVVEVSGRFGESVSLFDGENAEYIGVAKLRSKLRGVRDDVVRDVRPVLANTRAERISGDEEMRALIRECRDRKYPDLPSMGA